MNDVCPECGCGLVESANGVCCPECGYHEDE